MQLNADEKATFDASVGAVKGLMDVTRPILEKA
jgi:hypothetical protein